MCKLNIVMAAFNQLDLTERTIKSVLKNTVSDYKFIIVNNGSDEDFHEMINERYIDHERISYLRQEENKGCGIGRNVGLRELDEDCEYVILIDNDIYVCSGWEEKLIDFMEKYPNMGIGGPSTNFAGTPQLIKGITGLDSDEKIEEFEKKYESFTEYQKVPDKWPVIGFCQIVRKEIFDKIGFFDENFELYGCEDNDFCYRAQVDGWDLAYIHSIFVYHHGHGGLALLGSDGIEQWGRNRDYFKEKHGWL